MWAAGPGRVVTFLDVFCTRGSLLPFLDVFCLSRRTVAPSVRRVAALLAAVAIYRLPILCPLVCSVDEKKFRIPAPSSAFASRHNRHLVVLVIIWRL